MYEEKGENNNIVPLLPHFVEGVETYIRLLECEVEAGGNPFNGKRCFLPEARYDLQLRWIALEGKRQIGAGPAVPTGLLCLIDRVPGVKTPG